MSDRSRSEAAAALSDSHVFLDEARALGSAGFAAPCLRSAYYAMFHAARALLLSEDVHARTHRGVASEFTVRFVNAGVVPPQLGTSITRALATRLRADYESGYRVTAEEAEAVLRSAEDFVGSVEKALRSGRQGPP